MNNLWTKEEIDILKEHYPTMSVKMICKLYLNDRTEKSVYWMAKKLNLSKQNYFTQEEKEIIRQNYCQIPIEELASMLQGRSIGAICKAANRMELKKDLNKRFWRKDEEIFISENWNRMSDYHMAEYFQCTIKQIQHKRLSLGFKRSSDNYQGYDDLKMFLRANIGSWKRHSMKQCDYKCIITGEKVFDIHHTYSFTYIISDMFDNYDIFFKENFADYTIEELDYIKECFIKEQNKHPYGVCIHPKIHKLFHSMYGKQTTENQWNDFYSKCKNHEIDLSFIKSN